MFANSEGNTEFDFFRIITIGLNVNFCDFHKVVNSGETVGYYILIQPLSKGDLLMYVELSGDLLTIANCDEGVTVELQDEILKIINEQMGK